MSEAKNTALGRRAGLGYSRGVNHADHENENTQPPRDRHAVFRRGEPLRLSARRRLLRRRCHGARRESRPRGRDAIRAWVTETSRKYQPTFTLLQTLARGDHVSLAVAVSGQFPGSPVTLDYELQLRDGKISTLTIE
jgi:hypothetical protein